MQKPIKHKTEPITYGRILKLQILQKIGTSINRRQFVLNCIHNSRNMNLIMMVTEKLINCIWRMIERNHIGCSSPSGNTSIKLERYTGIIQDTANSNIFIWFELSCSSHGWTQLFRIIEFLHKLVLSDKTYP